MQRKPRTGTYYGMPISNSVGDDGTWLEGEEFTYPSGGFHRRAYCKLEDDSLRVIQCSIPDTFFSIPGFYKKQGKRIKGFITSSETGFKFIANAFVSEANG
jgi:hypothetical protein